MNSARRLPPLLCLLAAFALRAQSAPAAAPDAPPRAGSRAPDFALRDENGAAVTLAGLRAGGAVLLAFYPRDFTGG